MTNESRERESRVILIGRLRRLSAEREEAFQRRDMAAHQSITNELADVFARLQLIDPEVKR